MMHMLKKAIVPALALSLVFMLPARAVEPEKTQAAKPALPNEIVFQVPMNNYCAVETPLDFSFQLSNASDQPADLTVQFYNMDGSLSNLEGTSLREIQSNITPGKAFSLAGYATKGYHYKFNTFLGCGDRMYLGKITVNSRQASLLARGWVKTNDFLEVISVNNNNKFDLAVPAAAEEAPPAAEAAAAAVKPE